ncbi:DUF6420 family protein [Streptomyces hygroscopicus]|uniref:DUF6420 family protein n=1 Tax=Streptomyces hygroscopicus TaxID=1912 RepID=UPI003637AF8E
MAADALVSPRLVSALQHAQPRVRGRVLRSFEVRAGSITLAAFVRAALAVERGTSALRTGSCRRLRSWPGLSARRARKTRPAAVRPVGDNGSNRSAMAPGHISPTAASAWRAPAGTSARCSAGSATAAGSRRRRAGVGDQTEQARDGA